ncbi:hypothetical protein SAMN05216603_12420 [Pseudomonas benzenivorans]|nr:hypothetical protein SAMN05216603_12420 [Pseudomonas benzenivorans]
MRYIANQISGKCSYCYVQQKSNRQVIGFEIYAYHRSQL